MTLGLVRQRRQRPSTNVYQKCEAGGTQAGGHAFAEPGQRSSLRQLRWSAGQLAPPLDRVVLT